MSGWICVVGAALALGAAGCGRSSQAPETHTDDDGSETVASYDGLTDVLSEARRSTVRSRECLAIDAVIRGSGDERCRPR